MNVTDFCVLVGVFYLLLTVWKIKDKMNKSFADFQGRFDEVNNSLLNLNSEQNALQEQIDCIINEKKRN